VTSVDDCELHADLGWALGTVFRSYIKTANTVMAEVPGGPRGYQVLTAAARGLAGTQLALAQQLGIDRTVMTYLLDDIERAGLVERRPDPADRRARRVIVTEKGQSLVATLQQELRHVEDQVLSGLFAEERETFRALLRRLAVQADAIDPMKSTCDAVDVLEATESPGAGRSGAFAGSGAPGLDEQRQYSRRRR
jgi:DNA-binding MarR family transcriptional regulator